MKITSIDYWRLHSLGQFENERIGLHAEVDPETENIFDCFKDLKATELSLQKEGYLIEESKRVAEAEKPVTVVTGAKKPTLDEIESLKSIEKTSSKGPYQLITKAENSDNPVFDKLRSYIEDHKGFVTLHDMKFWNFSQSSDKMGYRKK